jgi:hypothetical protein
VERKRQTVALCHTSSACKIVQSPNRISRHVGQDVGTCKAPVESDWGLARARSESARTPVLSVLQQLLYPLHITTCNRSSNCSEGCWPNLLHISPHPPDFFRPGYNSIEKKPIVRSTAVGYKGKAIPYCPFIQLQNISIEERKSMAPTPIALCGKLTPHAIVFTQMMLPEYESK